MEFIWAMFAGVIAILTADQWRAWKYIGKVDQTTNKSVYACEDLNGALGVVQSSYRDLRHEFTAISKGNVSTLQSIEAAVKRINVLEIRQRTLEKNQLKTQTVHVIIQDPPKPKKGRGKAALLGGSDAH